MGGRNSRPSATPAGPRIVATNVPSVAQARKLGRRGAASAGECSEAATSALTGGKEGQPHGGFATGRDITALSHTAFFGLFEPGHACWTLPRKD